MAPTTTPLTSTDASTPTAAGRTELGEAAHLHRVRSGVRAVLALGVAASVAANVLHAEPTIVGRAIGAWSPLALLLTVELISRVPAHRPILSALRMAATALIAGIAAWVSYWHMVAVVTRTGETSTSAHLLPLSVDGLVVVASVSLVEIAARLHQASAPPIPAVAESPAATVPTVEADDGASVEAAAAPVPAPRPAPRASTPVRRPAVRSAAEKVTRLRAGHPAWTVGQIAAKAGVTERTARRHLNATPTTVPGSTTAPAMAGTDIGTTSDIAA